MARFNTQPITGSVTAGSTLAALTQNAFIQLTGTAPYTVTLPSPVLFPGFNQTFYNATSGVITLTTPAGNFVGAGGSGTATVTVPTTSTINLVSDGVNYVVVGEDGTSLTATTGLFSGNVTINGAGAILSVTPQTVTINPGGTSTIDNINIGATTRGSGAFNTLTSNNAVTFTANTASSSTGTGTVVVTGGVGVSGNINSGGTVAAVALSGPLTGTIQTAAQPNITSVGNLTSLTVAGAIGSTTLQVGANPAGVSIGVIGIPNQKRIYGRNTANTADVNMMYINGSDSLVVGPSDVASFASTGLTISGTTTSTQFRNNGASGHYGWTAGSQGAIFTTNATPGLAAQFIVDNAGRGTSISTQDDNASSTGTQLRLGLGASTGATNATISVNNNTTGGYGALSIGSSSVIFNRIAGESMRIHTDGNVGIGTNAPAYKLHVAGTSGTDDPRITPINSSVAVTATKVFVYDTRKDSDGGAWRKRTQHTSWYNETLNSGTRGSRKEFPSVAIIVAISGTTGITIYDGDDPLMPMWIKYTYLSWDGPITGISAVNGIIAGAIGTTLNYSGNGLVLLDFIKDRQSRNYISGYSNFKNGFVYELLSTTRINTTYLTIGTDTREYTLGNYNATDVAMTVLPNAPIDSATGLPIPTIAVTTFAGIYVIHNNGIVNSINATDAVEYNYWRSVSFTKDYKMIINGTYLGASNNIIHVCDIPYNNFSGAVVNQRITALNSRYYHSDSCIPNLKPGIDLARIASTGINTFAVGGTGAVGFTLVAEAPETVSGVNSSAMVAYVLPTFNTGWMVGNIKATWLADSTVETLTTTNLITNPTFTGATGSTGPTSWDRSALTGSPTFSVTSNILTVNNTSGTGYWLGQVISGLVVGKTYSYSCTVTGSGAIFRLSKGGIGSNANTTDCYVATAGAGTYTGTFLAESGTTVAVSLGTTPGTTGTFTAVSVWSGDTNRSIGGNQVLTTGYNGLQTFGSITKSLIDTGNDLVAYSGFSGVNYLISPFNSNIDIGGNPFTISIWVKTSALGWQGLMGYHPASASASSWALMIRNDGYPSFYNYTNDNQGNNNNVVSTSFAGGWTAPLFGWQHIVVTRTPMSSSPSYTMYVNGQAVATQNIGFGYAYATGGRLTVGYTDFLSANCSGSLALAKVSLTPMSPAQVTKMYNDEKMLFNTGAKGCIYGSSAAITNVAFDDDTNLLHVGNTAGRSVFNGLRRVDNTATAVATSISAANGLVAEQ
jgi:hypothetical protein